MSELLVCEKCSRLVAFVVNSIAPANDLQVLLLGFWLLCHDRIAYRVEVDAKRGTLGSDDDKWNTSILSLDSVKNAQVLI